MELLGAAADLIAGARCVGCAAVAAGLCPGCREVILGTPPFWVDRPVPGFPGCVAAGHYQGPLAAALLAAKERGGLTHLGLLGLLVSRSLATVVLAAGLAEVSVVAVPSNRAAVIERGLDFTGEVAARAVRRLRGTGLRVRIIRPVVLQRVVADQSGLDRQQRADNLRSAYRWRSAAETAVILLDDVVTTGATLAALAVSARSAGVQVLAAATIAETPKRMPERPS